ncbi:MAG: tRNA (guanosine(37)-N1)-methyltransferase TrmD [Rickettsiales bacterium]|jgi:tRNA (guanine37-N1)-methyltransferase|nr:tRNA (guanosine(37)-N1)-methyltransferase TrmD [Rickettsiales bacterium]
MPFKANILTLFPESFSGLGASVSGRAIASGALVLNLVNIRDFATDRYKSVDDAPYGGGAGQVLKPEILARAIDSFHKDEPIFHLSPRGERFVQKTAAAFSSMGEATFVCGHYEGIDERVVEYYRMRGISIGDFVLSGGEAALCPMLDAIARLLPGVLGNAASTEEESFSTALDGRLEYPQYTRPESWRGLKVPGVLLSGHAANIAKWRKDESVRITLDRKNL